MPEGKRRKTGERSFARMLDELESWDADFERFRRSRSLVPLGWHSVPNSKDSTGMISGSSLRDS